MKVPCMVCNTGEYESVLGAVVCQKKRCIKLSKNFKASTIARIAYENRLRQ